MEATQEAIDWWMNKQNMVYKYNGILLSLEKEEYSVICYNTDETWGHYAKRNKHNIYSVVLIIGVELNH